MLKMKLEKLGQLTVSDLERALASLEAHSDDLTDGDCEKLLGFTLRMAQDDYRPCASVVQGVWKLCSQRSNARLTLEHIDLYLRINLHTDPLCTSEDILDLMETHQLEASYKVLESLILVVGRSGDLAGATRVLALMKERNLPVTETIFSAFIMAHAATDDCTSIESVLGAMTSMQITPTSIAYEAMMYAYGVSGHAAKMKQVETQMKQAGIALSHAQLTWLLLHLAKSGQSGANFENLDYVVQLMRESESRLDLSRTILQLIHCGCLREAVYLMPLIPLIHNNNHLYANAAVYVQEMVYAHTDISLVVEMCKQLQLQEINRFALHVALEHALRMKKEELAWLLLRVVKESGCPLREHYFWPLLCMNAVASEPAKLLECVRKMIEMGQTPGLETLRDHIIPGLIVSHPDLTLQMLTRAGLTLTMAATPLLIVLIKNSMLNQAIEFVKKQKATFSLRNLMAHLASAWPSNPRTIIELLALIIKKNKEDTTESEVGEDDWGGQFVLDLAASRTGLSVEKIRPLFEELRKNDVTISESSADLLMTRSNRSIQEAIRNNINIILDPRMGQPPKEQEYNILPHPRSMTLEELDGHMVELQSKGMNVRGTLRKLMLQHATKNQPQHVLALMKKAKEVGIKASAGMMAGIIAAYVSCRNADAALDMLSELQVQHAGFSLDSFKIIDLCTLLIEEGRSEEGVLLLEEYIEKNVKVAFDATGIRRNCRNLLMAAATTGDCELTSQLFSKLLGCGFVRADNLTLGALVKCRLNSGDLAAAVTEAETILKKYKCLPMRIEILIHLIHHLKCQNESMSCLDESRDSGKLNTAGNLLDHMLNLIAECHGPRRARHDLLFACLEAGQPVEARKVVQNLGEELDMKLLNRQFDRYLKTEQDDALRHFLTASRGNTLVDRHRVFSSLLNIYYVQSAGDKALSLWTMMQEESLPPSETFLSTLASVLAANNMKIPFQIQ
nr:LRPPRC [Cherax quadricarinatus]